MTTDLLPGVTLTQIPVLPNATLNEASLYPCLVSPLYRVVTKKKVQDSGTFVGITPATFDYPVIDAGAIVDQSTVVVSVSNAVLAFYTTQTGALPANPAPTSLSQLNGFWAGTISFALTLQAQGQTLQNNVFRHSAGAFVSAGVQAGDIVKQNAAGGYSYVIAHVVNETTLIFTTPINMSYSGTDTGYRITRVIASQELPSANHSSDSTQVTVNSFVTDSGGTFLSGEVNLSYRALRTDKTGLFTFTSLDEVQAMMETTSIQNKLGYFIEKGVIPANGNSTSFMVYILTADNSTSYLNALGDLTGTQTYMFVPLCDNLYDAALVKNAFKSNMGVMSAPPQSAFRVLLTDAPAISPVAILGTSVVSLNTTAG